MTGSYDFYDIQNPPTPPCKDGGVQKYFENLGYYVGWDHNRSGRWFELYDGDNMVAQIDMDIPLEVITEDMIAWHLGKEPVDRPGKPDWVCSGNGAKCHRMKELFKRVYNFSVNKQMPNGQLGLL